MICVDELFDTTGFTGPGTPRCFRNTRACHMVSDLPGDEGSRELMEFARRLGLRQAWVQEEDSPLEHFDLVATKRARAVELGAREVGARELLQILAAKDVTLRVQVDCENIACTGCFDWLDKEATS